MGKNNVRDGLPQGTSRGKNMDKIGKGGVIGTNPSPALSAYPQSIGPDTLPTRFAESGISESVKTDETPRRSAVNRTIDKRQVMSRTGGTVKKGGNVVRTSNTAGVHSRISTVKRTETKK